MIRLASINIEGERHIENVLSFLDTFKPDVVCLQELSEHSVSIFEKELDMKSYLLPVTKGKLVAVDVASPEFFHYVAIYSNLPVFDVRSEYYYGAGDVPEFIMGDEESVWRGFVRVRVEKDGRSFTIATTHFTRTDDGSTSEKQRKDLKKLLELLGDYNDIILCGDFNAPRGGEIFTNLATRFKDNIPAEYDSSIDPKLHRAPHLKLMVDGLFTTPQYEVTDAKLSEGVSDHKAITALVSRGI